MSVENLQDGEYELFIRGMKDYTITIKVHQGAFLSNMENIMLKKSCIQEIVTQSRVLRIYDTLIKDDQVDLTLVDFDKKTRVHLMATNFVTPNHDLMLSQLMAQVQNQIGTSTFNFAVWKNLLMSNRELSDEYRYVFDRALAERNLGNSLDRPSLLNKRLFNRKTELE